MKLPKIITGTILCVAAAQAAAQAVASCASLGRPDVVVTEAEVFAFRFPNRQLVPGPPSCRATVSLENQKWKAADRLDWQTLANKACSARLGWVERSPGICQAGGPPPVCPRQDHWLKVDSYRALQALEEENKKVAEKRELEMIQEACNCWRKSIEQSHKPSVVSGRLTPDRPYDPFVVPCSAGCPPGTQCEGGVCRPPTVMGYETGQAAKSVGSVAAKSVKRLAFKELMSQASIVGTFLATKTGGVAFATVLGLFDSKPLSIWRQSYEAHLAEIQVEFQDLARLYLEESSLVRKVPGRAPDAVKADIQRLKQRLIAEFEILNQDYGGMVRENELKVWECREVFEYQQQRLNQTFANYLSLPE